MKVFVLGGEGMLGHKMFQVLSERFSDTVCSLRGRLPDAAYRRVDLFQHGRVVEGLDAMDLPQLEHAIEGLRPEFIVNCVGVVKQRDEARDAIPTITLNSLLPHRLAQAARRWGGRVIHVSTDCVFSGNKGGYTENDRSDAEDLYGKSKYLGEVTAENALTLRTSIIGRELMEFRSLLEWFLAQRGRTVRGFKRVIYSGVTTNHLAKLVASIISSHPELSGLYQVAGSPITKHDLLGLVRDAFRLDVEIVPDETEVSDRSMSAGKLRMAIGHVCPPWTDLVSDLAADPTPYEQWRMRS